MRATCGGLLMVVICAAAPAVGHETDKLPAGPIRDRHELMESMGQQAKDINTAFNIGAEGFDTGIIQRGAQAIALSAHRIPSLFPPGSTDPNSRALPAIWEHWDTFQQLAAQLEQQAAALSTSAGTGDGEDLSAKADKLFATCKTCHDQFRAPEKDKKGH